MRSIYVALCLCLIGSSPAIASTECVGTVSSIAVNLGPVPRTVVTLDGLTSFSMAPGDASYREVIALATTSQATSTPVTLRFAADEVECSAAGARTDLSAFISRSYGATTTTPTTSTTPAPIRTSSECDAARAQLQALVDLRRRLLEEQDFQAGQMPTKLAQALDRNQAAIDANRALVQQRCGPAG